MPPVSPGIQWVSLADATALAVDPSVVVDAPVPVRTAASFLLVLAFGGAMLYLFEEFVGDAIESSMERPLVSMVYGLVALGGVLFLGVYALSQVSTVAGGGAATDLTTVAIGVLVVAGAGVGYTVVGTRLVEAAGYEGLWRGLVVGAAVSAVVWLLPSFALAVVVWAAIAGVGIGGPTKNWIHASESVETTDKSA